MTAGDSTDGETRGPDSPDDATLPPPGDDTAPRSARPQSIAVAPPRDGPAVAAAQEMLGTLGARFEALRVLGMGGMGVVLSVRDRALGREVALKLIRTMAPTLVSMFREEARALASLEHDHVVRIYEYGVEGQPFIVMELVRGKPLSAHLAAGRPPVTEAVRLAAQIARGVEAAHVRGIVHRDLKPANVFLDEAQRAKVADFGLALRVEGQRQTGGVAGTPGYMAPEQARGDEVGAPADVYALGVILHELLAGRRLFTGPSLAAIIEEQRTPPAPPSRENRSVPPELDQLVASALAYDSAARPAVAQLAAQLEEWLSRAGRRTLTGAAAGLPPLPYKLLVSFGPADTPIFFGRDAEAAELAGLIANPEVRLVTVFGPCGIGKSSLLAAGLGPALDPRRFRVLALNAGPDPAGAIRAVLAAQAAAAGVEMRDGAPVTAEALALAPAAAAEMARAAADAAGVTLVLLVDQLEEVFTQNPRGSPRVEELYLLIERLTEARGPVKVVLSYRTEFRGELYPLEKRLERVLSAYPVRELDVAGLAEVVEGPARLEAYGFSFEPGLAGKIAAAVHETAAREGTAALPTTQIVCHQLHEQMRRRGGTVIDTALYEQAIGGARGALTRYVEERLADPARATSGPMARQILRALTVKEEGRERFSHARPEEELLDFPDRERARATLEALVSDRLVVREDGPDGQRRVRLASEVICPLVDQWSLEPDEAERAARMLARAHRQWEEQGRREEDLLSGAALALVAGQLRSLGQSSAGERAFVTISLAARRSRLLRTAGAVAVGLAAVAFFAYTAFFKPGTLMLSAEPPDAEFLEGARSLGVAAADHPLTVPLRPGPYTLTVRRSGYDPSTLEVRVPAGGEAAYHPVLSYPMGMLSVSSDPRGASCAVVPCGPDGRPAGAAVLTTATPFTREVRAGRYALQFTHPGYLPAQEGPVVLETNRRLATRAAHLVRDAGLVQIDGPETAVVTVADAGTGAVALTATLPMREPRELDSGRYVLVARQNGCAQERRTLSMAPGISEFLYTSPRPLRRLWSYDGGTILNAPVVADLRGAGPPDVVVAQQSPEATAMDYSRADLVALDGATGKRRWITPIGRISLQQPEAGDLDGDGKPDLVLSLGEGVIALSGLTGKRLWQSPGARRDAIAIARTPAGAVVVVGVDQALEGLSGKRGARAWITPVAGRVVGLAIAAAEGGDDVVVSISRERGAAVARVNARDGRLRWVVDRADAEGTFVSLAPLTAPGAHDVIVGYGAGVMGLDARTGHPLWDHPLPRDDSIGFVLSALPRADGRADVVLSTHERSVAAKPGVPATRVPARAIVLDGRTGALLGEHACASIPRGVMPLEPGREPLFYAGYEGDTKTAERLDGTVLWSFSKDEHDVSARSIVDLDGDAIADIVIRNYHEVIAYSGDSARFAWGVTLGGPLSAPAVADLDGDGVDDVILNTGEQGVTALSGATGDRLWRAEGGRTLGVPTLAPSGDGPPAVVVLSAKDGLAVLDGRTGARTLVATPGDEISTVPVAGDLDGDGHADLVAGTKDHRVVAWSVHPPRRLWSVAGPSEHAPACAIADLDGDGHADVAVAGHYAVTALTGATGKTLWNHDTDFQPTWVAIGGGAVFASSKTGDVVALAAKTGKPLWKTDLTPPSGNDLSDYISSHAPVTAFVARDVNGDGVPDLLVAGEAIPVTALDGRTGKPLWKATSGPSYPDSLAQLTDGSGRLTRLAWAIGGNGPYEVVDARTGAHLQTVQAGGLLSMPRAAALRRRSGEGPELAVILKYRVEGVRLR